MTEKTPKERLTEWKRTADMMSSAHSVKSEECSAWHTWLNGLILITAIFIVMFAFAPEEFLAKIFHLEKEQIKFWLGIAAASNFAVVLVDLNWRFGENAVLHDKGAEHWRGLKHEYTTLLESGKEITPDTIAALKHEYSHPPALISDKDFNRLKQRHWQKVALSKAISASPNTPGWIIQSRLLLASMNKDSMKLIDSTIEKEKDKQDV